MQRYKITLSYDGTSYSGWQVQPQQISVQGTIEQALDKLSGEKIKVHGSGRTDSGVHARRQVAHFDMEKSFGENRMTRAMNAVLPEDIRILDAKRVPDSFHARKSARLKEYRYFIWNREVMPPPLRLYRTHIRSSLDVDLMQSAANHLIGEHNFRSFCAARYPGEENFVRTIKKLSVTSKGGEVLITAAGTGFLYKMVRSMAGFLIRVGQEKVDPLETISTLKAQTRTHHVETARPHGLFLWNVRY